MILLELKAYIKQRQRVSLQDILVRFDLSAATAEAMLERLIQQGHISKDSQQCSSQQCHSSCHSAPNEELYFWRDKCLTSLSIPVEVR